MSAWIDKNDFSRQSYGKRFKGVLGCLQWSGDWYKGKDFHLFLLQVRVILKFCVKFQYLCSSKACWKSNSAKKKQNPCVYELEIIIYWEMQKRSAWLVDHQGKLRHGIRYNVYFQNKVVLCRKRLFNGKWQWNWMSGNWSLNESKITLNHKLLTLRLYFAFLVSGPNIFC